MTSLLVLFTFTHTSGCLHYALYRSHLINHQVCDMIERIVAARRHVSLRELKHTGLGVAGAEPGPEGGAQSVGTRTVV